jgi:two-component system heavy metal sensor histidine kinase CusS
MALKLDSARAHLMFWSSGVLFLALLLFGFEVYSSLRSDLLAEVDGRLYAKADGVKTLLELENVSGPELDEELTELAREIPEGQLLQLSTSSGEVVWPNPPAFPSAAFHLGLQTAGSERILRMPFEYRGCHYEVLAGASLQDIGRLLARLRTIMLMVAVPMLLLAGGGGFWLSRRALAPVDAMTRAAQSIRVESLSKRLPVPSTGDEIERLATTWNELLERLEISVKRIQQFTADASHELRTPVALIRSTAELALRRERTSAEYRKALLEVQSEAEQMTQLIESMLALARSDAHGSTMPLSPVDLKSLIAGVVSQSEILAEAKGVRLDVQTEPSATLAQVNEAGLRRLLRILLDNALEHTPAGGHVTVSLCRHNGSVELAVRDTGEGIPPAALPHIFERFYRADEARGGNGAGLGLSIAQLIAQAHGARLEVESQPGLGSCFRIALAGGARART